MWEILLQQARGIVLLADQRRADPVADLRHYLERLRQMELRRALPLVVGVTHTDEATGYDPQPYLRCLSDHAAELGGSTIPVARADMRHRNDVRRLLLALTSMMEFCERFPRTRGAAPYPADVA